jgi:hypothetical protein
MRENNGCAYSHFLATQKQKKKAGLASGLNGDEVKYAFT